LWVMSMLIPIAPSSKSTMARLPIHITHFAFFRYSGPVIGHRDILLGVQSELSAEHAASGLLMASYRDPECARPLSFVAVCSVHNCTDRRPTVAASRVHPRRSQRAVLWSELNQHHCIVGEQSHQLRSRAGHDYPHRLPHRVRIASGDTHNSHAIGPSFPGEGRFDGSKNRGVTRPTHAQLS
jgi:hypothetical protein